MVSVLIGVAADSPLNKVPVPTHTVFDDIEMATALVAHLEENEKDGWNYLLEVAEDGKSAVIKIYDETGYFLGLL